MLAAKEFYETGLDAQSIQLQNLLAKLRHVTICHATAVRARNRYAAQEWLMKMVKLYREIDTICFEHLELAKEAYP